MHENCDFVVPVNILTLCVHVLFSQAHNTLARVVKSVIISMTTVHYPFVIYVCMHCIDVSLVMCFTLIMVYILDCAMN